MSLPGGHARTFKEGFISSGIRAPSLPVIELKPLPLGDDTGVWLDLIIQQD